MKISVSKLIEFSMYVFLINKTIIKLTAKQFFDKSANPRVFYYNFPSRLNFDLD